MKNATGILALVLAPLLLLWGTDGPAFAGSKGKSKSGASREAKKRPKGERKVGTAKRSSTMKRAPRSGAATTPLSSKVRPLRSTRYAKVQAFDVAEPTVSGRVFKTWVKKIAKRKGVLRRLENGDFGASGLEPRTAQEIKAEFWKDSTTTLTEAEALEIVGYLEAAEQAGASIQVSDWGDASAEWIGMFIVVHKPGDTEAVVLDVLTDNNM